MSNLLHQNDKFATVHNNVPKSHRQRPCTSQVGCEGRVLFGSVYLHASQRGQQHQHTSQHTVCRTDRPAANFALHPTAQTKPQQALATQNCTRVHRNCFLPLPIISITSEITDCPS